MKNNYRSACVNNYTAPRQRGVGLIEVLVALIVISLGVLGMAGLQLTGMKQSTNGFNRAKAVMLAENMTTRMRINPVGVADGHYDGFDTATATCNTKPDPYCQAYEGTNAEMCDSEELADFDMFSVACGDWSGSSANGGVNDLLPADARMQVTCDSPCVSTSNYALSVNWAESKNASSDETQSSQVLMRLRP